MNSDEVNHAIRSLAFTWAKLELPFDQLTYADYVKAIDAIYAASKNLDRMSSIFDAVLTQAIALGRDSTWVEHELRFEARATAVGDRPKLLCLNLVANGVTNAALDLYNERLKRFQDNG